MEGEIGILIPDYQGFGAAYYLCGAALENNVFNITLSVGIDIGRYKPYSGKRQPPAL